MKTNEQLQNDMRDLTVAGNKATLSGGVDSRYEKLEAEHIAWKTAGVSCVKNEVKIDDELV